MHERVRSRDSEGDLYGLLGIWQGSQSCDISILVNAIGPSKMAKNCHLVSPFRLGGHAQKVTVADRIVVHTRAREARGKYTPHATSAHRFAALILNLIV